MLILEGAQVGLYWLTVLRKRDGYRRAFGASDVNRITHYDDEKIAALEQDPGIIRNRPKVHAAIANARATLHRPLGTPHTDPCPDCGT
jgi:DNA-3-methyladenine glycosylase I